MPFLDSSNLPGKDQLQQTVNRYLAKCSQKTEFNKLLEGYALALTKAESYPTNLRPTGVSSQARGSLAYESSIPRRVSTSHYGYLPQATSNRGCRLGTDLRQRKPMWLWYFPQQPSNCYKKARLSSGNQGKYGVPLRNIFECPHTPPGSPKAVSSAKGASKSTAYTGKSMLVVAQLLVLLDKLGIKSVESLCKWEDKLGIKEKYVAAQETIKELFKETQYDWENPAEYKARQEAARQYQAQMLAYDQTFNAVHYYANQAEELGYLTTEALQFVLGEAIVKGVGKVGMMRVAKREHCR